MQHFSFSQEIATLTISLFVAGYCVGPLVWGPLSETVRSYHLLPRRLYLWPDFIHVVRTTADLHFDFYLLHC